MSPKNKRKMHPRNIFRTPPDYTDLAIKYEDFRKVCKLELTGKVCIDYKNESALRALTQTLLQEYFQLHVEFAPGSLIPTLPLRLNYILWIEDLVKLLNVEQVHGIDVGCGSSCIYSLLVARKNQWKMLALESNAENLQYARENVQNNKLQQLIEVFEQKNQSIIFANYFDEIKLTTATPTATILSSPATTVTSDITFQFCLCNPPFYDSTLAQPFAATTRNPEKRPAPRNCHTGHAEELACDGGEVAFVQRIVEESLLYPSRICIFTSMLGHKSSLVKICDFLRAQEIFNFTTTEFCQGNTTRWGVAWSLGKELDLSKLSL